MSNKFLKELKDEKNRRFPLVYKHVKITEHAMNKSEVSSNSVFASKEKDTKLICVDYYKRISKLL